MRTFDRAKLSHLVSAEKKSSEPFWSCKTALQISVCFLKWLSVQMFGVHKYSIQCETTRSSNSWDLQSMCMTLHTKHRHRRTLAPRFQCLSDVVLWCTTNDNPFLRLLLTRTWRTHVALAPAQTSALSLHPHIVPTHLAYTQSAPAIHTHFAILVVFIWRCSGEGDTDPKGGRHPCSVHYLPVSSVPVGKLWQSCPSIFAHTLRQHRSTH